MAAIATRLPASTANERHAHSQLFPDLAEYQDYGQKRGGDQGDGHVLDLFFDWTPDQNTRRSMLVDTPARLFGD